MKISMYAWFVDILARDGIERAADIARELGCEAVEFIDIFERPSFVPNIETAKHYRKVLASRGISVACYSVAVDLIKPDYTEYDSEAALEYVFHAARMAEALGSPFLHHTVIRGLGYDERTYQKDFGALLDRVLPYALRIADECERRGLTTLYEPQGMYFNGKERFVEFYKRMKAHGKRVGVCGDMGNSLFCDWRPENFYATMIDEIKHVHVKDYQLPAVAPEGRRVYRSMGGQSITACPFGEGDVDLGLCFDLLREIGYDGALSLEGEYNDPIEQMKKDISFIKSNI